jgi:hypothetical protein
MDRDVIEYLMMEKITREARTHHMLANAAHYRFWFVLFFFFLSVIRGKLTHFFNMWST